jgi:hypothetical protein
MTEPITMYQMFNEGLDSMVKTSIIMVGAITDPEERAAVHYDALEQFPEHELRGMLAICLDRLAVAARKTDA